jgi:putative redox protein
MTVQKIKCTWKEEMAFEAEINGHSLMMDADESVGGKDRGPRPKPLTLVSLAGCTGMDVISILGKMRIKPDHFDIEVGGELSEEHPKYYQKIHLDYHFHGKNLDEEKIRKAVELSQEKYCGVSYLLGKGAKLSYTIHIH